MKYLLLLLVAACGTTSETRLQTTVQTQGLDASLVRSVELFIVQPDEGVQLDCDSLLTPRGPFIDGAVLYGSALVTPTERARITALAPGAYLAVAFAYDAADGVGTRIGAGCAPTGVLAAGETKPLTLTLR